MARCRATATPRRSPAAHRRAPEAKASIARRAAACVRDDQVVVLDGGTTTLELARALRDDLRASVITTSPPIALALADHPGLEVTVVGGTLRPNALVTVGAAAVEALRVIRADVVFLGVCGLHPEIGVTTEDLEERHVKAAMIEGAAEVVALADHDKLGTAMPVVVAPMSAVTQLVTDADVDDAALAPYLRTRDRGAARMSPRVGRSRSCSSSTARCSLRGRHGSRPCPIACGADAGTLGLCAAGARGRRDRRDAAGRAAAAGTLEPQLLPLAVVGADGRDPAARGSPSTVPALACVAVRRGRRQLDARSRR